MTRSRVAVVGGGPAGLSAALAVASAGAETMLIDEHPVPGGRLRYRRTPVATTDGTLLDPAELIRQLVASAEAAGVVRWPGVTAWALFPGPRLALSGPDPPVELAADRVILATGSTDRPYPFPGGSLSGVFSARAMQLLLNHYHVRSGRRFVVIGDGPESAELVADIAAAGGKTVAVVDGKPAGIALAAEGSSGVERVMVDGVTTEVDTVVVAVGRQPDADLARLAGAEVAWRAAAGGHIVVHAAGGETSVPGIFVTGDAAGVTDITTALSRGQATGLAVAATLGLIDANDPRLVAARAFVTDWGCAGTEEPDRPSPVLSSARVEDIPGGTQRETGGSELLCRCEEVSTAVVLQAIEAGAQSVNDVKRRTRAGMGACQGCFCTSLISTLLHRHAGIARSEVHPMTARPPVRLLPLERLAGQDSTR